MDEKLKTELNAAFEVVESHDIKVSVVGFTGTESQRKKFLSDLKEWKKVSKSDGDTAVVCNCLDSGSTVCPLHG